MAAFTAVLAVAAIYQFIILNGQLSVMRKEQRPWMLISFSTKDVVVESLLSGKVHIVNKGKRRAREIVAETAVEVVENGDDPVLNYPAGHDAFTMGLLFPEQSTDADSRLLCCAYDCLVQRPMTCRTVKHF
jgi:hypothetical protein